MLDGNIFYGEQAKQIQVPLAQIRPLIFVPGFANTLPSEPTYDQSNPWETARTANSVAQYNTLFTVLEKMGYERDKTYFEFVYDWFQSHMVSASYLIDNSNKTRMIGEWQNENSN